MLPSNPNIQHLLMKIPFPPRPPQPLHLRILQPPPHNPFQLLPTNFLHRLTLFIRLNARFKARLHSDADRRFEGERGRVATDVDTATFMPGVAFANREEGLFVAAVGLQRECTGEIGGGDDEEGFAVGNGGGCRAGDAVGVAA